MGGQVVISRIKRLIVPRHSVALLAGYERGCMFSIFVRINVHVDRCSEFAEASLADAQGSVRDEPGCVRFDIHRDAKNPNRFYLYEVYRDREAFEVHLKSIHFKKWLSAVEGMVDGEFERVEMEPVFPSSEGWERQKSGLLSW